MKPIFWLTAIIIVLVFIVILFKEEDIEIPYSETETEETDTGSRILEQEVEKVDNFITSSSSEKKKEKKAELLEKITEKIEQLHFNSARGDLIIAKREQPGMLTDKDLKVFEEKALLMVKPIPASNTEANRDGYNLLRYLDPDNLQYEEKYLRYKKKLNIGLKDVYSTNVYKVSVIGLNNVSADYKEKDNDWTLNSSKWEKQIILSSWEWALHDDPGVTRFELEIYNILSNSKRKFVDKVNLSHELRKSTVDFEAMSKLIDEAIMAYEDGMSVIEYRRKHNEKLKTEKNKFWITDVSGVKTKWNGSQWNVSCKEYAKSIVNLVIISGSFIKSSDYVTCTSSEGEKIHFNHRDLQRM